MSPKSSAALKLALCAMLANFAAAKVGSCYLKFDKNMKHDYCTKFGTGMHTTMDIDVRAKLTNFASVTPDESDPEKTSVRIDIAAVADQDYERIQKANKQNCQDYRSSAAKVVSTVVPLDGSWSNEGAVDVAFKHNKVST